MAIERGIRCPNCFKDLFPVKGRAVTCQCRKIRIESDGRIRGTGMRVARIVEDA